MRDTIRQLFGDGTQASSTIIPNKMGKLSEQTSPFGLDFDTLLKKHTIYPFLMLFAKEANVQSSYQILRENLCQSVMGYLGLQGTSGIPSYLRYCPICQQEEIYAYGEPYWHRLHQTTGVFVCGKHGVPLCNSKISTASYHCRDYISAAAEASDNNIIGFPYFSPSETARLSQIEEDIQFCYSNASRIRLLFSHFGYSFADLFLTLLHEKGLATQAGTLRREALLSAMESQIGSSILLSVNLSLQDNSRAWLIAICRHGKIPSHPVKYILMAELLCGSMESFLQEAESYKTPPTPKQAYSYCQITNVERLSPYRERWLSAVESAPKGTRNEAIEIDSAAYQWLRRHDPAWLNQHQPTECQRGGVISCPDWAARDSAFALSVGFYVSQYKSETIKPHKITKTRLAKDLGIGRWTKHMEQHLPKTNLTMEKHIESIHDWRCRRIR